MEFELYLIRHGESEANITPHLIGGRSEEADLTDKGKLQAQLLGIRLKKEGLTFDAIYCSSALRARRTCGISLDGIYPLDQVAVSDKLVEMSQGKWEGEDRAQIHTDPVLIEMNTKGKFFIPANGTGESQRMVERRVSNWFEDELLYNPKYHVSPNKIAIFTHSQWIRAFLHYVMNHNDRLMHRVKIDNTSITKLYFDQNGWGIGPEFNDTSHLKVPRTGPKYDSHQRTGIVRTRGFSNTNGTIRDRYLDILDEENQSLQNL